MPMKICNCGRRMGRYDHRCKICDKIYYDKLYNENKAIVSKGKCPTCGATLRQNLSLTGWWQCSQFGADTHRLDPSKPACDFQCFTE